MRSGFRWVCFVLLVSVAGCGLFKKKEPQATNDPYPTDMSTPSYAAPAPHGSEAAFASSAGSRTHTVARKETLFSIARTYYNDQSKWRTIYEANRSQIGDDPNRIRVGQQLVIP